MADLASLVIKVDSRDIKKAQDALKGLGFEAKRVDGGVSTMGLGFRQGARDAGMLGSAAGAAAINLRTLGAAAAAAAVVAGARGFISMADDVSMLSARINLLSKSTTAYQDVQGELLRVANSSQTSLSAVGQLYSRLITPITKLGGSSKEALGIVESLSSALLMSGASAEESASVIRQFSQAMGKGKLNGDEFISIAENAPIVLRAMEDQLNKTTAEIYEMAEAGELTAGLVGNTMLKGIETFTAGAAAMPQTVAGAMTRLKNEFTVAADEINKSGGITGGLAEVINLVSRIVPIVKDGVIAGIKQFQGFLERNKDTVSAIKDAFSITAQVVGMVGSAVFGVLGMVVKVATESGLIKTIFNAIAGAVQIAANGMTILGAAVIKAGDFVIEKLGNPLQDIIQLLEKAARAVGLNGIADALAVADKAFDKSRSTAVAWADSVSAKVRAGNFNVLGFSLATDKAAEAVKKATPDFVKLGDGAAGAGKAGAAELKKMQKAADEAAAAIERTLQSQQDAINKSVLGESGAARADFGASGASGDQQATFAQSQAMLDVLAMVDKAWADIDASQKTAAESAAKYIDDFLAKDFGSNLAAGFDKAGQALGSFVGVFEKLVESQTAYDAAREAASGDAVRLAKLEAKQQENQLGLYGDLTGSAKGFFKEGTKGYKSLQAAEQVFRAAELAQTIINNKAKLAGYAESAIAAVKSAGTQIASLLGIGQAAAVTAPAAAAAGTPGPASFVAYAAMAALMAGLGFAVGGSKKGPGFTDNNGTGTVLGDSGAQSKSIKNSIEALESAASLENRISSAMLASLKNIEANISGLASLIVRGDVGGGLAANVNTGFKMDGIGNFLSDPSNVSGAIGGLLGSLAGPLGTIAGAAIGKTLGLVLNKIPIIGQINKAVFGLIGGLFGSKSKITGQGLTAVSQTLGDIMQNGFDLLEFVAIQTKKKAFGITTSTKNSIKTGLADPELTRQFGLIFSDFGNAIVAAADPLGFSTETIAKRLESFVVDIGKINLKGLKGDEIQEKLEAVFGAQADKMAEYAFPMLTEFQKVGEGLFETVVRVASGIEQADTLLQRLGLTAVNYTTLLNTQGDIATEIIRQSVLLTDRTKGIAGGFAEIVANFQGTGEEITDLVLQLRDMQDAIRATGKAGEYLTTFMIAGAGGADRLTDGLDAFFDFLSPAEQAAELTRRVSNEFTRIGQIVPQSAQGFRELIAGIDISTEAGQKLYGQVIALAPAFSDLQDALASVKDEAQDAKDAITKAFKDLSDAIKTAESDLQAAFNRESAALKDLIRNHDDAAKRLRDFSRTLVGALDTPEQSLARLRAEFDAIARAARLGDSGSVSRLPEAGGALKDAVLANAVTALDAAREIAKIRAESDAAATVQERQKTIAEQQLDALNDQVGGLIQVENATLSVRDAVDNLRALQSFENKAISDATASGLGALITQNGQTQSAIEKGTAATNAINSGIASLVSLQAKQEADRQAALAAQQAEVQRTNAIKQIEVQAAQFKNSVLAGTAIRTESTADLATLTQKAIDLAKRSEVALNANVGPRSAANDATFGVNEAGLFEQKFGQVTALGKNQSNMAQRLANFNAEFYKAGGLFEQINAEAAALSAAKAQIDPATAQLETLRNQVRALGGIPAFAAGGMHSGGLRVVGENGPELEYTGPSRIFNAGQTSSMLDNSDQIAELRALRDEMKGYLWSISKSTLRTADRLDRWDDGDRMNVRIDNESDDPALVRTVA